MLSSVMSCEDFQEPSVESKDKEERIVARRLRIRRREAKERIAKFGYDPQAPPVPEPIPAHHAVQLEDSYQALRHVEMEGIRLVTNIRVAAEARTANYFAEKEREDKENQDRLENERKNYQTQLDEYEHRWQYYPKLKYAQEFQDFFNYIRYIADTLLEEKDKYISDLKIDMDRAEKAYTALLLQHYSETMMITDRMHTFYKEALKGYTSELGHLETAYLRDRKELRQWHKEKWEKLMSRRRLMEERYQQRRLHRLEHVSEEIENFRTQSEQEIFSIGQTLDNDVFVLHLQLQRLNSAYQINQEKLEYNYQILRKREDENTQIKFFQKRRLTRLHDTLSSLRQRFSRIKKQATSETKHLLREHARYREHLMLASTKAYLMRKVDESNFHGVWFMNEDEAKKQLNRVLNANLAIHYSILGIEPEHLDLPFLINKGPLEVKRIYEMAKTILDKTFAVKTLKYEGVPKDIKEDDNPPLTVMGKLRRHAVHDSDDELEGQEYKKFTYSALKVLLTLVCNETPFLTLPNMERILVDLDDTQKLLIRADALLKVLNMDNEDELNVLATYFSEHVRDIEEKMMQVQDILDVGKQDNWVLQTPKKQDAASLAGSDNSRARLLLGLDSSETNGESEGPSSEEELEHGETDLEAAASKGESKEESKEKTEPASSADELPIELTPEDIMEVLDFVEHSEDQLEELPFGLQDRVLGKAHPNDVIKVLRQYLEERKSVVHTVKTSKSQSVIMRRLRDNRRDLWYWTQYTRTSDYLTGYWNELETALLKMYKLLHDRAARLEKIRAIQRENSELRLLLRNYVTSNENSLLNHSPLWELVPAMKKLPHPVKGLLDIEYQNINNKVSINTETITQTRRKIGVKATMVQNP